MQLTIMKARLHRAAVTEVDRRDEGSISIDAELLEAAGILPHEHVEVFAIDGGGRFTTCVAAAPRGSKTIGINGAAAGFARPGDRIVVAAYAVMEAAEARVHEPTLIVLDQNNAVVSASDAA